MLLVVLAAVALACGGGGTAVTEKNQAVAKTPEEEFGEQWSFDDLVKHFNKHPGVKQLGVKIAKIPSVKHAKTMYFVADGPDAASAPEVNDDRRPGLWSGFGVEDHGTRKAAVQRVMVLRDQQNEPGAFAWGKYVFRGPDQALADARRWLP
jgi:hypothetical protein